MGCAASDNRQKSAPDDICIIDTSSLSNFDISSRYSRRPLEDDFILNKDEVLGEGVSGAVLKARSRATGMDCAVKLLSKKRLPAGLREEVNNYLKLDHPHVARLFHVYEEEHRVCLVMELCSGKELYDRLLEKKRFCEQEAKQAVYQMLLAIAYLHKHNMVHCDVKLENFMYESCDKNANLKLIDFGYAKTWLDPVPMTRRQGTVFYSAPEMFAGSYNEKCDIWSLGVVLFMMLSGCPPFPMQDEDAAVQRISKGDYQFKEAVWSTISEQAQDFVRCLLTVDVDERLSADQCLKHPWLGDCDFERRSGASSGLSDIEKTQSSLGSLHQKDAIFQDLKRYTESSEMKRAALTMIAHHLNSGVLGEVKELFLDIDTDKTGTITRQNFRDALRRQTSDHGDQKDQELAQIFDCVDVAHDGELHYSEFIAAMLESKIGISCESVRECFDLFDVSRTGTITCQDLQSVLGAKGFNDAAIKTLVSQGKQGDGTYKRGISFEEFDELLRGGGTSPAKPNAKLVGPQDQLKDQLKQSDDMLKQQIRTVVHL
jgi:calcium-dependent protein kinase